MESQGFRTFSYTPYTYNSRWFLGSLSWNFFKFETIRFKSSTTCRHWRQMMQMPSKTRSEWSLIIGKSWPGSSRIFVPKVWFWLLGIFEITPIRGAQNLTNSYIITQRLGAPIFLWNESSFSFTNTKITFRKLSNVGSSPTQNHCCWDYAVPLDTYLENTVGDGKTPTEFPKSKTIPGHTVPHHTKKTNNWDRSLWRPRATLFIMTDYWEIRFTPILRIKRRTTQISTSQYCTPPPLQQVKLEQESNSNFRKSDSGCLWQKQIWVDPFPGLLVTTRWLADIFRLQMAPGIPN